MMLFILHKIYISFYYIKAILLKGGSIVKNKAIKLFASFATLICTLAALSTSASACTWALYQPKEPKCLRE